ncbi:hypothetical protein D3C80_1836880 [compost metagenome]
MGWHFQPALPVAHPPSTPGEISLRDRPPLHNARQFSAGYLLIRGNMQPRWPYIHWQHLHSDRIQYPIHEFAARCTFRHERFAKKVDD